MTTEQSPSRASTGPESKFLKYFADQHGPHLICILRDRIPGKMWTKDPDEYDSQTKTVLRSDIERDLAGYLFHHYSAIGGLPVFEKIEGQR
jgi:hypothetical protein